MTRISSFSVAPLVVALVAPSCRCESRVGSATDVNGASTAGQGVASSEDAGAAGDEPRDATTDPEVGLPPLTAPSPLVDLEVSGFRPAVVSVPVGATAKRPIVVALHGNYDRPEWQCEVWREVTEASAFVLCPRGIPRADAPKSEDRWTYGSLAATEKELFAAIEALRERFGNHVELERSVFTGFSLGAILGKSIVVKHASRFPRAAFVEGGYKGWSRALAEKYDHAGGERVLFACGQSACVHAARAAERILDASGLETRVADGGKAGHTYDGTVMRAVMQEWRWLTQGENGQISGKSTRPETR